MNIKIIDNLSDGTRHLERVIQLLENCKEAVLISPFLMPDFYHLFAKLKLESLQKIEIITTLPPNSIEQFSKINSLTSLLDIPAIRDGALDCQISVNNRLHGKIYIFKMPVGEQIAIITSANLTQKGLSYNHEWGVEISDLKTIANLEQSVKSTLEFANITQEELLKLKDKANAFLKNKPEAIATPKIDLALTAGLRPTQQIPFDKTATFWLKPIGVTGDPVTPDWPPFDAPTYPLHFHWNPRSVKKGDIMICYGIGAGKVLSVYRVISEPQQIDPADYDEEWMERWSWFVDGENLSPKYGANWFNYELYLSSLRNEFLKKFPEKLITGNSQSLGALNYKKDKFRLSPEFAQFILDKVIYSIRI